MWQNEERPTYEPVQVYSFDAFNTSNVVHVYGDEDAAEVFDAMHAEAERYEMLFSHTDPRSALSQFNRLGGNLEDIDPELAELIDLALAYSTATDGLFDPTCCGEGIVLGGIAKGYIADALCDLLKQYGIKHGFVNLGGNVKVFGGKPGSGDKASPRPFIIGLRVPQQYTLPGNAFAHVQLTDGAVVTSGIYERGIRLEDGSFSHHILDPRTGMPAETDIVSTSLISETALDGDGYTTALIVMGLERALDFVEALPGCEAVFVARDKTIHATSGIGSSIPFTC